MPLQFITGPVTADKSQAILDKIMDMKSQQPGARFFYLVPDPIKFNMERHILSLLASARGDSRAAMIDLQVVSFDRLAWFMGDRNRTSRYITDVGLKMVLQTLIRRDPDQWRVFRRQLAFPGFYDRLLDLFKELFQGAIEGEDLRLLAANAEEKDMLDELSRMYEDFVQACQSLDLAEVQGPLDFINYLDQAGPFPGHYIFIDHMYHFSSQELLILLALVRNFDQVFVCLPASQQQLRAASYQAIDQVPIRVYSQISQLLDLYQEERMEDWDIPGDPSNYQAPIRALQEQFRRIQGFEPAGHGQDPVDTVSFRQYDSIQTEARHVANKIHQKVASGRYRYSDIVVKIRDMDRYKQVIGPYFTYNEIPFFYDHRVTMDQHPLTLLLEAFFKLKSHHFDLRDLMAIYKSPLVLENLPCSSSQEAYQQLFLFENILIENGYLGYRFADPDVSWNFARKDQAYENAQGQVTGTRLEEIAQGLRQWGMTHLVQPIQAYKEDFTGSQASRWLYEWLETAGIREALIRRRDQGIQAGQLQKSLEYEQVWDSLIAVLEEFDELFKDQKITFQDFSSLVMSGLKEATFNVIPPTLDKVTVTPMTSIDPAPYKLAFIIGADNSQLPRYRDDRSLLPAHLRQDLAQDLEAHQFIDDYSLDHANESFLASRLLASASQELHISFARTGQQDDVSLSPYFDSLRLSNGWPLESVERGEDSQKPLRTSDYGRYPVLVPLALQQFYQAIDSGRPLDYDQLVTLKTMALSPAGHRTYQDWLQAIADFNQLPDTISPQRARALYGDHLHLSVSRVESYYQDPYSYFLLYGLRLKERPKYQLDSRQVGDYYHELLDQFFYQVIQEEVDLDHLTKDQVQEWVRILSLQLTADYPFDILTSSPHMKTLKELMDRSLLNFLSRIRSQHQLTLFQPLYTERRFGLGPEDWPGLNYSLDPGQILNVSGKIDRIDTLQEGTYFQVIDYKSSGKPFTLQNAYYGLDIQLLTYLAVAQIQLADLSMLGGFYQGVRQNVESLSGQEYLARQLEEKRLQNNRLTGLVLLQGQDLAQIDKSLAPSQSSLVYPVRTKKDMTYTAQTQSYIPREDMEVLLDYVHQLYTRAGKAILAGDIRFQPFEDEPYTPSLMPGYRTISGFDATEIPQAYRQKQVANQDVIGKIRETLYGGADHDPTP